MDVVHATLLSSVRSIPDERGVERVLTGRGSNHLRHSRVHGGGTRHLPLRAVPAI